MELTKNAAKVLELVKELSLIEMNSLVKAMEEEFGVSAAAGVMVAGAAAGGDAGAAAGDSDSVSVELADAGQQKIAVIKVVKEILNVDLKAAKDLVEKAPTMVKENIKSEEAEAIKSKLEEAGAKVNLR